MQITTDRLVLREYVSEDWPDVLAYQRNPQYLRYYPWNNRTEEEVRDFVRIFVDQQNESPRKKYQLAVTLLDSGELIGSCGIRRKLDDDWEADIGFELAPRHWGNGYATESARLLVDLGFEELKLHRISSWCIADNTALARVLERVGLRLEGRLRESDYFKGRWWDTLLFALLEQEWAALRSGQ